jgi:hypothetical protein
MKSYYENVIILEKLRELSKPTKTDFNKVHKIIKDDDELTLFFYDALNPGWVELLDNSGEFDGLKQRDTGMIGKYKAHYLKQSAMSKAESVLEIIEKMEATDINIQGVLVKAIKAMPAEMAAKGVSVLLQYIDGKENKFWYSIGAPAGELMVKLVTSYPDKAFEIAETLLDAWVSEEKAYGRDIVAKFPDRDYQELIMEYYDKVWNANPEQAIRILITILNRCIEDLDKETKGEQRYDASISFGYSLELGDLNEIDMQHPSIKTLLVKGICEAGKVLIDKEPEKISKLLDLLEGTNRVIFQRIAMYLLRFVKPGTEKERIDRYIGNEEYFKEYNPCWHEHRRLLNDKFDDVSEDVKKAFLEWVEEDKYSKETREEITERCKNEDGSEPDFEKLENHAKAEELYLVREKFKDEYDRYKDAAGVKNDSSLAPRKMVSEARFVSPTEGAPLTSEKMQEMTPEQVLAYVSNPDNYKEDKNKNAWDSPSSALAATLREDAKKRSKEYLICDLKKLTSIPEKFLSELLYGIEDAIRDGSFVKENWARFLELSYILTEQKGNTREYERCYRAIVAGLRGSFSERENSIELDKEMARQFSQILAALVRFPTGDMNVYMEEYHQKDPVQLMCVIVAGEALGVTVSLGIACKKRFPDYWENELRQHIRDCWDFALNEIREPGVNCVFGLDFRRIHWLDEEWVKKKIGLMFVDDLWNEVWGTYTSWGRPSPEGFDLLLKHNLYKQAVEKIGAESRFKFAKNPDKGLVEHLMAGYFNGWIGYEDLVTMQFFNKASAELRGEAARFLTTGFKPVNEEDKAEEKEKVAVRMQEYWKKRLSAIRESAETNSDEAEELTGWVCDSVLPAKDTLELLEQSLELSGGKIGNMRDARDFIVGICESAKDNELLALRCLKKAAADENMHKPWSRIQEPLAGFLEKMVDMSYEIRSAAAEVADAYGRYNPDKFQAVWEKLKIK